MKKVKAYPEIHQQGSIEINSEAYGGGGIRYLADRDFGVQISDDGRVWICIDGAAFIRFKPKIGVKK